MVKLMNTYETMKYEEAIVECRRVNHARGIRVAESLCGTYCKVFRLMLGFNANEFRAKCLAPPPPKESVDRVIDAIFGKKN